MERAARNRAWQIDESRYRLLVESITDYAIYMLDPGGIVTSWNPGARRFKGYTAAEIIGQHFSRFYVQADRDAGVPREALRTATEQGRFEAEGWRLRKDGSRFWAHVVIDAIRGDDGTLIGFAKITRDLTERRASEDALRRSEQRFALLVQGVTDYAIYMLDAEGHVSSWNAGAERIKGYRADEIIGSHVSRFYPPEDAAAGAPAVSLATAAREGRWESEGWRLRKDGGRFWAHVVIDAIRDDDGTLIGFAKITRDITERRETQRALEQTRETLFQAQKMDAIGQLTGGVAHDFNNLLMAVLGSLELVQKRLPFDPRISPLIENAAQAAQRGAILTQRMLAFARKQELALEPVDLAVLAAGMREFLERTLGPDFQVSTRIAPGLPHALSDANQIEVALLNLAVNARDAMAGGGEIVISGRLARIGDGHPSLPPGDYVALGVTDSGFGMDEATRARAVEPFFTTKGIGKGTGLGLSMVHGLALQSGGSLEIASRPGAGSTVEIFFPATAAQAAPEGARPAEARVEATSRPLTILAVDDDNLVLMNTAAMLEDLGHQVVRADSGAEALRALALNPDIDLIITDQAMPQMTGLQLAEKAAQLAPGRPVIIASGYAEALADHGRGLARLAKPFTQDQLARAVQAALPA